MEVDLHGKHLESALRVVKQAVSDARRRGLTRLAFITGKGLGAPDGQPVLKPAVETWLRGAEARGLGVRDTQPGPGGGALQVDLAPPERTVGGEDGSPPLDA
jgi:DNA-nicking Smr family endonuclease